MALVNALFVPSVMVSDPSPVATAGDPAEPRTLFEVSQDEKPAVVRTVVAFPVFFAVLAKKTVSKSVFRARTTNCI